MTSVCRVALALLALVPYTLAKNNPHILFVVLDDVGFKDVGYHGGDIPTPNIDALAATGTRLEQMYVQPVCSPTRSSFMTGRYAFHTGMQHFDTLVPGTKAALPKDTPTVAELLRDQGYETALIGKWHLGAYSWDNTPTGRGFNAHVGYFNGQVDYYNKTIAKNYDFWSNKTVYAGKAANGTHSLHQYMREFDVLLQGRPSDKPFFLYFSHQLMHLPLDEPDSSLFNASRCSHIADKSRNTYCHMMTALDDSIGDTVQLYKAHGMWDDTLLVLSSDNGGMVPFQKDWPASAGCNEPLRAGKTTLFEGGVRSVALLNGGDNVFPTSARGRVDQSLWHAVDLMVTMAKAGGAVIPTVDGFDMLPSITSTSTGPRTQVPLNINFDGKEYSAIRVGDLKLVRGKLHGLYDGWYPLPPAQKVPAPKHQGTRVHCLESCLLFNITADPGEHTDLSHSRTDDVKRLVQALDAYMVNYTKPQTNLEACKAKDGVWMPCE